VLEWTQFDKTGRILRGVDWFVFEAGSFRIQEIRAYGAAPIQPDLERQELRAFDYVGRGYPMTRPELSCRSTRTLIDRLKVRRRRAACGVKRRSWIQLSENSLTTFYVDSE